MAKKDSDDKFDEALDVDGNPTVPMEDQLFLLPADWDPSTDSNGGSDLGELPVIDDQLSYDQIEPGWNEKLGRWIDTPPGF